MYVVWVVYHECSERNSSMYNDSMFCTVCFWVLCIESGFKRKRDTVYAVWDVYHECSERNSDHGNSMYKDNSYYMFCSTVCFWVLCIERGFKRKRDTVYGV